MRLTLHPVRRSLLASALTVATVLTVGCGHATWVAVPVNPAAASSSVAGVTMTVTGTPWEGEPDDLTDYLTVVAVEVVNQSNQEVRVSYADFMLTDQTGFRYAAVNPLAGAEQMGSAPLGGKTRTASARPPTTRDPAVPLEDGRELEGVLVAGRYFAPVRYHGRPGGFVVRPPPGR